MNNLFKITTYSFLLMALSATSYADKKIKPTISHHSGHVVTGWNQYRGKPILDLPILGKTSFPINGVCGDTHSIAIDASTPLNSKLCTHADPTIYKAIFNVDVNQYFPLYQNVPLADFPQIYNSEGDKKSLPNTLDTPWYDAANGAQLKDYRLKDWIKAKGSIRYHCTHKNNYYEIEASNLVPGGLYTLWLFYFDQVNSPPPLGMGGLQKDLAFGGSSSNVMVADMNGSLKTKQLINFCPQQWRTNEQYQPLNLHLVLHPEGRVYGTVAEQLMSPPYEGGPGIVAVPHLMFPFPKGLNER